tara:strand:- start:329 stop:628 length:300 start_codon:yes stop_codon:yes gene_type:complete
MLFGRLIDEMDFNKDASGGAPFVLLEVLLVLFVPVVLSDRPLLLVLSVVSSPSPSTSVGLSFTVAAGSFAVNNQRKFWHGEANNVCATAEYFVVFLSMP